MARFVVQEFLGRAWQPLGKTDWLPGSLLATTLVVAGWTYFLSTGNVKTIWPMFGVANQLLACVALCVGTAVIVNSGRAQYAWVTAAPLCFVAVTTLTAGFQSAVYTYLPMKNFQGYLDAGLIFAMMTCVVIVAGDTALHIRRVLRTRATLA